MRVKFEKKNRLASSGVEQHGQGTSLVELSRMTAGPSHVLELHPSVSKAIVWFQHIYNGL
jgi:hypothetical protein